MAIVPMRQTVNVARTGGLDEWGNDLPAEAFDLKCRVDEGTFLVKSRAGTGGNVSNKEVVTEARILLDGLADVRYGDTITFTNELGQEIKGNPEKIDIKRHINGKPLLTEVYI